MMREDLSSPIKNNERPRSSLDIVYWVIGALAFCYILFLLYQSVYFNYQTSLKIKQLRAEIQEIERDHSRLEALIAYYKTDTFQELEARKKLGFKRPEEKTARVEYEEAEEGRAAGEQPPAEPRPPAPSNLQKWLAFIKGEDLEQ